MKLTLLSHADEYHAEIKLTGQSFCEDSLYHDTVSRYTHLLLSLMKQCNTSRMSQNCNVRLASQCIHSIHDH